jgi:rhodanese-related sulfurtransferase
MNRSIDPHSLHAARPAGEVCLIDVRTPAEYGEVHIEGSHLMPMDSLDPEKLRALAGDRMGVLVCRSGKRAANALAKMAGRTPGDLSVLEGGINAWDAAGLPLVRGQAVISLERQVRIAAGMLILAGAILAALVHPAFVGLCAFVGAGLLFAGISDWCGMAMLLAKMPWNRRSPRSCAV